MSTAHRLPYGGPEWIERIRSGDEAAFEALFRAFAPGLCSVATRQLRSRAEAEELVQELFLDLWRRRGQLAIEQGLSSYLYTAVRNRVLNHAKREQRFAPWSAASGLPEEFDTSSSSETELLDALEVQDAIDQLPPRCRLIFTLNRQQEMTYSEIAKSLGLSIKTVETQMGRALKTLRVRLAHLLP
ncbi:MAG: RNA polymerase sigma-70 factor [bacterium]